MNDPVSRNHVRLRPSADGILDLGACGPEAVPTSSVRTVHVRDGFLKFSLDVRITNCVRKHAWYELPGAVHATAVRRPHVVTLGANGYQEPR